MAAAAITMNLLLFCLLCPMRASSSSWDMESGEQACRILTTMIVLGSRQIVVETIGVLVVVEVNTVA